MVLADGSHRSAESNGISMQEMSNLGLGWEEVGAPLTPLPSKAVTHHSGGLHCEVMGLSSSSPGSFTPGRGSRLGSHWVTAMCFSDLIRLMEKAGWGQATPLLPLYFLAKWMVGAVGFWFLGSAGKET